MLQEERPLALFTPTNVNRLFRQDAEPSGIPSCTPGNGQSQVSCWNLGDRVLARADTEILTDFGGGHGDVVPRLRLSVQCLGQRDPPVVHVDVELPLQVCVPVDEVPGPGDETRSVRNQETKQGQ